MYSPVFHVASRRWCLGRVVDHIARPLSEEEIKSACEVLNSVNKTDFFSLVSAFRELRDFAAKEGLSLDQASRLSAIIDRLSMVQS